MTTRKTLAIKARRWRRFGGVALLLVPALVCVAVDVSRRGGHVAHFEGAHRLTYGGAILESVVLWAVLLFAASRRRGWARWALAFLFVVAMTFSFGGQTYFYGQYNAYLNLDLSTFASNFMDSVLNQLFADLGNYLKAKVPPLLLAIALVMVGRRLLRPKRTLALVAQLAAPVVFAASLFIPTQFRGAQASTPDVLYLHAMGGAIQSGLGMTEQAELVRPRARESMPVAKLAETPPVPRNVLLVLLESVRADSACIEYDPSCERTAATNELLPDRYPLTQMRSLDSATAISLAVLWSGVGPHESREVLHTWPLVFDYARAAGWDTAYWTSQNMLFGNARLWVKNLGVRRFVSATDMDPSCDVDTGAPENLLADQVNSEIGLMKEPFFATVHLSNVHYPYYVDPAGPQPYQPQSESRSPADIPALFNAYKNAIYQQDQHLARMIQHLRGTEAGQRTVIVYVSDHGEAFREHGHAGHTFSVYDEEIHVPAWIDAPPGTLTPEEIASLTSKKDRPVFQVDVAPTLLDLMGVLDAPELEPFRGKWLGHSLLRPEVTTQALPLTNCATVWSCAFENWGYIKESRKLIARAGDEEWHCFDVDREPDEQYGLPLDQCGELEEAARATFRRLPGKEEEE